MAKIVVKNPQISQFKVFRALTLHAFFWDFIAFIHIYTLYNGSAKLLRFKEHMLHSYIQN